MLTGHLSCWNALKIGVKKPVGREWGDRLLQEYKQHVQKFRGNQGEVFFCSCPQHQVLETKGIQKKEKQITQCGFVLPV